MCVCVCVHVCEMYDCNLPQVNKLVKELISIAEETVGGTQLYYVMNVLLTEVCHFIIVIT